MLYVNLELRTTRHSATTRHSVFGFPPKGKGNLGVEMVRVEPGPTRQSRRDRTKTTKALEQEKAGLLGDEAESDESVTETTIHVSATPPSPPGAPRSTRDLVTTQPKNQATPTRARPSAAKAAERLAAVAATTSRSVIGRASAPAGQNKVVSDLIAALLSAIEEQKQERTEAIEEQRRAHANQIETLTEMFTKQIETLKAEVADLIQT